MTPAQWAVEQVCPAWLRSTVGRSYTDAGAIFHLRRYLSGARSNTPAGFVVGDHDGLRYSAPDGETGRIDWAGVVEVLRASEMQRGLW